MSIEHRLDTPVENDDLRRHPGDYYSAEIGPLLSGYEAAKIITELDGVVDETDIFIAINPLHFPELGYHIRKELTARARKLEDNANWPVNGSDLGH